MRPIFVFFALILLIAPANAGTRIIRSDTMGFDQCLATIRTMASTLGVAPINIIESNDLRMVRFWTNDGSGKSYLVSCSRPDRKLVVNESW